MATSPDARRLPRLRRPGWGRLAAVAAGAAVLALFLLPERRALIELLERTRDAGLAGAAALAASYAVACLIAFPTSILTMSAGFAFGVAGGVLVIWVGAIAGALLAFLLGRTLLRRWVEERVRRHPRLRALDRAVGTAGFKVVALIRLSPFMPFGLSSYAFGATRVPLPAFLAGTAVGMVPSTLFYAYVGSALRHLSGVRLADAASGSERGGGAFWGGLAISAAACITLAAITRRELKRGLALPEQNRSQ